MKRYGLLGRVLTHSFSQAYFSKKFAELGLHEHQYQNFELAQIADLPSLLQAHPDLRGLNVTIPYKEVVLPFLHESNDVVNAIGACNCILLVKGKLYGYNTDVVGFELSLLPHLKPFHRAALVLGSGGASKAVIYVLKKLGLAVDQVSRNPTHGGLRYEDIGPEVLASHQLIVNTTPLGTFPKIEEAPPLPYDLLNSSHFLFDLIYNPAKTVFLTEGERSGAQIANGYAMLVAQAEESWRIWTAAG